MQWSDAGIDSDGSLQVLDLVEEGPVAEMELPVATLLVILFLLQRGERCLGLSLDARHRGGELGL